uniref:Uncharacterized protein n=1 Tax=Anas platyrhynchos platyrhynchos TaxID=8840 RepID=A0A493TUQ3_ANAPP
MALILSFINQTNHCLFFWNNLGAGLKQKSTEIHKCMGEDELGGLWGTTHHSSTLLFSRCLFPLFCCQKSPWPSR